MLYLVLITILALQIVPPAIEIYIDSSGIAIASMRISVHEGLNAISLPVEPIVETIEVTLDNQTLIPLYENGTLYIFAPTSGIAKITYLVNISARDNVLRFYVDKNVLVKLVLSSNIVLLTVPTNLVNFSYMDSKLVIEFYGPQEIEYIAKKLATVTPTVTETTVPTVTTTVATTVTVPTTVSTPPTATATVTIPTTPTTTTIATVRTETTTTVTTTAIPRTTASTPPTQTLPTAPTRIPTTTASPTTICTSTPTPIPTTAITATKTKPSPVSPTTVATTPLPTASATPIPTTTPTITTGVSPTTPIVVPERTTLATSPTTSMPRTPIASPAQQQPWLPIALGIVVVAVVAVIAVAIAALKSRRSSSAVSTYALSDVDIAILRKLEEKGGSALQVELQRELGIPKTTLWRHIRKLEKLGYVRIVKEGTFNRVYLLRKP